MLLLTRCASQGRASGESLVTHSLSEIFFVDCACDDLGRRVGPHLDLVIWGASFEEGPGVKNGRLSHKTLEKGFKVDERRYGMAGVGQDLWRNGMAYCGLCVFDEDNIQFWLSLETDKYLARRLPPLLSKHQLTPGVEDQHRRHFCNRSNGNLRLS